MTAGRRRRALAATVAVAAIFGGLAFGTASHTSSAAVVPIRGAFYYPWFPETWVVNGQHVFYHPTLGYYDSSTQSVVDAHIRALQYGKVNVGIASWWGPGTHSESTRIPQLLNRTTALASPLKWALYYEPEGYGDPTLATVESDLAYVKANYASQPAYEQIGGKPVIFVYNANDTSCAVADKWKQAATDVGLYVVLKVFSGFASCASQPDSWHQYGPSSPTDEHLPYSYTISPGFWRADETSPRLVRDITRWKANVKSMVASGAQWQLITTFNEWGEGTAVESATEWKNATGFGKYLTVLHNHPTSTTTTSSSTTTIGGSTTTGSTTTSTTVPPTTTTVPAGGVCGNAGTATLRQKVVVFAFENRTWSGVGGTQFQSMPYFNSLAKQCATFSSFTEPDTSQNSATQYVGTVTGSTANTVLNDCSPSSSCNTTADNIFRQARTAGLSAINYVEGATTSCSASGNAAKHIPTLYLWGADDRNFCTTNTRPFTEFDPNNVPDFSFVTPTLCNDGHDCSNSTVDAWAQAHVQPVLDSAAYQAGNLSVVIWYDEDRPVPNMELGLHVRAGVISTAVDWGSALRSWEDLLGVPNIGHAVGAPDIRALSGL